MSRRFVPQAALVLFAMPVAAAAATPADRTDVLILYADDFGYADLGITGTAAWRRRLSTRSSGRVSAARRAEFPAPSAA
jgi:hypothetical protein